MSNTGTNHDPSEKSEEGSKLESEKEMIATIESLGAAPSVGTFPELSEQLERDLVQVFKLLADETRL